MKNSIEENLPYAWLAIIVIAVFYAIYFAKMISQKRHGIQTHQICGRQCNKKESA